MPRKTVLRKRDIIVSSALAVLAVVVVLLIQFMVIKPVMSRVQQDKVRLTDTVKELEENAKKRREYLELTNRNEKFSGELSVFYQRIPSRRGVAAVAAELLNIAKNDSSLRIIRQQPLEPVEVGQGFLKIPYEINVQGKFHNLGDFITRLETHPRFIELSKLDVTRENDNVTAQMTIFIYSTTLESEEQNFVAKPKAPAEPYKLTLADLPLVAEPEPLPAEEPPPATEPENPYEPGTTPAPQNGTPPQAPPTQPQQPAQPTQPATPAQPAPAQPAQPPAK